MSNLRVMLSRNEVEELLDLWNAGWTVEELAEKFDCSRATVSAALGELLDDEDDEDFGEDEEVDEDEDEEDLDDASDEDSDEDEEECDEEDK